MTRRSKPLRPALTPLTPELPLPSDSGKLTHEELAKELFNVRTILRSERIRHAKIEAALGRYNELLETTVTAQRQAFVELHNALVPSSVFQKGQI